MSDLQISRTDAGSDERKKSVLQCNTLFSMQFRFHSRSEECGTVRAAPESDSPKKSISASRY